MTVEPYLLPPAVLSPPTAPYTDTPRQFQGIPGLECAPAGRLWATWYGGGITEDRHNYILLATSDDDGKTWSELSLVIDPDGDGPVRAYDPCLWHDPTGRLWLFWGQGYEKHTDERNGVWAITTTESDQANPSWSEPVRLCDGVMMNKPTVLSSGEWLLPVARWHRAGSAGVYASSDAGITWTHHGGATIPNESDRSADEHMLVERRDGSLWMLVRARYGIGESVSLDRGRTWSDVAPLIEGHPATRFFVRRLRSGRLLLVKNGPLAAGEETPATKTYLGERSHLSAFLSEDEGQTWIGNLLLDERPGVSYPDGVQSSDGVIRVIYDRDRRGAKEILMARFTEEDILQGACVSDAAGLRILVDKAMGENPLAQS